MFNLKYVLLLALISYTLQDIHCLATVEYCEEEEDDGKDDYDGGGITHCEYAEGGSCYNCEDGYAASYDRKSCISFQNCNYMEEGNKKCSQCQSYYYPNSEGQCERTLCDNHDDNGMCTHCYSGYYLKNKECIKITIPYCKEVDEKDDTKCIRCVSTLAKPVDGKCIAPTTWIEGCEEYDTNGKCISCYEEDYYTKSGDTCKFISSCPKGTTYIKSCDVCEAGFTDDDDGWCIGHDGTKDTSGNSATGIKIDFAWLVLILAILI